MLTTELLTELAEGDITFGEFTRTTSGDFTAMATHLARRWGTLPPALQVQDLTQEMLLAVHLQLPNYNPAKGRSLRDFIVWMAYCAARKCCTAAAVSKKRDETGPLYVDVQRSTQEDIRLARELCELLPNDDRQRVIIESLVRTGSLDVTTDELLASEATRCMFINPNPIRARHSVYRTALKLALRAQATA